MVKGIIVWLFFPPLVVFTSMMGKCRIWQLNMWCIVKNWCCLLFIYCVWYTWLLKDHLIRTFRPNKVFYIIQLFFVPYERNWYNWIKKKKEFVWRKKIRRSFALWAENCTRYLSMLEWMICGWEFCASVKVWKWILHAFRCQCELYSISKTVPLSCNSLTTIFSLIFPCSLMCLWTILSLFITIRMNLLPRIQPVITLFLQIHWE